ncbi:MAG: hypothetical protein ABW178_09645 [Pseudoxanthomonas sp.]
MEALAKALVLAVSYIEQRNARHIEDHDVQALEEIASILSDASDHERKAFTRAAILSGMPELPTQLGLDER